MKLLRTSLIVALLVGGACSQDPRQPADEGGPQATPRQVFRNEADQTVGVLAGQTLYLSALGSAAAQVSVEDQTRSALDRLGQALGLAGLDYGHLVSCHVHLADMGDYAEMNAVYGSYFAEGSYPARTTLEVPGLPGDARILLACIAYANAAETEVVRPAQGRIPAAMGPYSPAVRAGRTVYLSGQGGREPATGALADSAHGQAEQTLRNIKAILEAAALSWDNVVLANSYLRSSAAAPDIDAAFEAVFSPGGAPSRTTVGLSRLPGDIAVEITFVAVDDRYVTRLFMHNEPATARSSPASLSGGVVYTSAMPGSGASFAEQFRHSMRKQTEALELALMDLSHVVRVTAYLQDLAHLEEFRALLAETFPENQPATTVVQARDPSGAAILVELIAVQ